MCFSFDSWWVYFRTGYGLENVAGQSRQEETGTENSTIPWGWSESRGQDLQAQTWSLSPSEVGAPPRPPAPPSPSAPPLGRLWSPACFTCARLFVPQDSPPHFPQLNSLHPPSHYNVKSHFLKITLCFLHLPLPSPKTFTGSLWLLL